MEKTNAEIVILAMLLKDINIKAGTRKADCRPVIEKLDEHIDAFVKAAVEEGYAESEESHLPEVFPRADIRTAEFEEDIRRRAEYPESLFPMATDILCRRVEDWFRRELLFYLCRRKTLCFSCRDIRRHPCLCANTRANIGLPPAERVKIFSTQLHII